jgi:hypothetical protein
MMNATIGGCGAFHRQFATFAFQLAQLVVAMAFWHALGPDVAAVTNETASSKIDFNREIRPILTENCFKCHGPDDGVRKANLRYDVREAALKPAKSGRIAIVAGSPEKSELMARVTTADLNKHMPPPESGKKLSAAQIDKLRRWIAEGAPYAKHWAYVKPVRLPLPEVKQRSWPKNPVDFFILARLEQEGLQPSPEADTYALIRRVTLDLTGLPPTIAEVDQFANDDAPNAYEKLVDQLLKGDAFGEHWARMWLDLARYADSAGYADDPARTIWAYRDYVIKAFNENKPFDQFTIEQIAGDLLPDATEEQRVATAFHRNTMTNNEGGTDDEEFRNAAIVDRVNTTMSVWMATSIGCAQCHHHKYDPISQQEYFRLFAILNHTQDADRSDEAPVLKLYNPEQKEELARYRSEVEQITNQLRIPLPAAQAAQAAWERSFPLELVWQDAMGNRLAPLSENEGLAQYANTPTPVFDALLALQPTESQRALLAEWYQGHFAPEFKSEQARLAELDKLIRNVEPNTVPVMVEQEKGTERKTHVQLRGNFRALAEEVTEGVPAVFPPLPADCKPARLALARWLVDPENPLTARVIANRFWEQIFGTGIVRTSEDFGAQGDLPTHPELLDWLATELAAQKWNVKAFLKMLVTSATYCQSSRVTPELQERDPNNLLLARGPRFRMPAEEVRDQALFVSGLLSEKMYGPPVRPPQPPLDLTAAFGSSLDWKTSEGEDRYRRAVYTEWRRTNPYPSLSTFDAPNREVCALRRPRSNTPLQALVSLNDPVYVEAAQALGRRIAASPGSVSAKAELGFRLCLARLPHDQELKHLISFYQEARGDYAREVEDSEIMAMDCKGRIPEGGDIFELAAWTAVGNVLLNLDETLMRR